MDLASYDVIIVAFSGGKDSAACVLHLLDLGVPKHKIELWHHLVDGREGSTLMDWPCTEAYC
jgi:tRNA(Ile)-lysidine synthase TilS/MesJ